MLNICIFSNSLKHGGAEKQAVILADLLSVYHFVYFVSYYGNEIEKRYLELLDKKNINILCLSGTHAKKIFTFFKLLRRNSIEVIFSYLLTTNFIAGIIGKLAGVKNIFGGIRSSQLDKNKIPIQRFLQNYITTKTIYNNYSGLNALTKIGFDRTKSMVIPNCFDVNIEPIVRKKNKSVNILTVGRFHESKDYLTAIKSVVELRRFTSNFYYYIIGYGPLENEIKSWINEYNANDFIKVVINPDNINHYYQSADIYFQTSVFEGLSNTIMEAMSFSLPIVGTNVGDNNKLIRPNFTGFITDAGQYKELSSGLLELINSYDMRIKFGLYSYELLRTEYNIERFRKRYLDMLSNNYEK